jgi:hypothetical protein
MATRSPNSNAVQRVRVRLASDHPTVVRYEDGAEITLSDDERERILDKWAEAEVAESMDRLRLRRDALLAASDWTQVSDAPVDAKAWATYRQDLRDLPAKTTDPAEPKWPSSPGQVS